MKRKWSSDKNNFLLEEKDFDLFQQLPSEVKMTIYTEFMFKKFIFRFRRFFDFYKYGEFERKEEPDRTLKKTRLIDIFQRGVNKVIDNN